MTNARAFTLVDSMAALIIALIGMAAVLQLALVGKRALLEHRERTVVNEILANLRAVRTEQLEAEADRWYDARGLPAGEQAKFNARITTQVEDDRVHYFCELQYVDATGILRRPGFVRTLWRPHASL